MDLTRNGMTTRDEHREEIIKKIKQAFPKNRRLKKLTRSGFYPDSYHTKKIEEYFKGESWEKFVGDDHISYLMSEIDYVRAMRPEVYIYYFPALLINQLIKPTYLNGIPFIMSVFPNIFEKFNRQRLEALLAFVEYFVEFYKREADDWLLGEMETLQLRIMVRLDELGNG